MNSKKILMRSVYTDIVPLNDELKKYFLNNRINEKTSNEILICLNEALNNVIKHSYNEKPDEIIELNIDIKPEEVELKIIDTGTPRLDDKTPVLVYDPTDIENLPESGMGLFIINQLMDKTNYEAKERINVFTLIKNLS